MSVRAKLQAKLKMTTAGSSGCLICQTFYKLNCQKQIVNLCLLGKCVNKCEATDVNKSRHSKYGHFLTYHFWLLFRTPVFKGYSSRRKLT